MKRFGQIIEIDPDRIDVYKQHHDNIWPEIVEALDDAEIRNYSIFHHGEVLFGYLEYHGPEDEYEQRMAALAEAPRMKEWWEIMGDIQRPLTDRQPGEFWMNLPCVFHLD